MSFKTEGKLLNAFLILCAAIIIGCAIMATVQVVFGPLEGTVTSKRYQQGYFTAISPAHYEPPKYWLWVEGTNRFGDKSSGNINVDSYIFHETQVGDFFSKTCMCVLKR